MGRDAGVTHADDRMLTAEPADRSASGPGRAFVAWLIGVVEIRAPGPLQQVARSRRHVAQLAGRAGHERARKQAIVATHTWIGGKISVAHQRTDAQAAILRRVDLV